MLIIQSSGRILLVLVFLLLATTAWAQLAPKPNEPEKASNAQQDEQPERRVEIGYRKFRIDVPAYWKVEINERLVNDPFLSAQDTNEDGKVKPASLHISYHLPKPGKKFPQISDDPKGYAELLIGDFAKIPDVEFKLQHVEVMQVGQYKGVKIIFEYKKDGVVFLNVQNNLISPDGTHRYFVAYGTWDQRVEQDMPRLNQIVSTIRFDHESPDLDNEADDSK